MEILGTETRSIVLRLERVFDVPRQRVFDAWTTPQTLKRWWCPRGWEPDRIEVDLRVGGEFHFGMRRVVDRSVAAVRGRFIEVRPPERIAYTWRWIGMLEDLPESHVTVEFFDENGRTRLVLTHARMPDVALWHQHRAGWIAACDRLERAL